MAYKVGFGGAVYLSFNGDEVITLGAKSLDNLVFTYHAESFQEAVSLGTLQDAIGGLLAKFPEPPITPEELKTKIDDLGSVPVIGPVVEKIVAGANIVVTDFVIDVPGKNYEFGMGMRFDTDPPKLGPVQLDGFAVNVNMHNDEA